MTDHSQFAPGGSENLRRVGLVAIAGRPNSGKSTLLNRILKSKLAIVSTKAQTTRERLHGVFTEPKGQIVFVDTPGIHRAKKGGINEFMVHEARSALEEPDLIWYLVDPFSKLKHEEVVLKQLQGIKAPILIAMNKADRIRSDEENRHAVSLMNEITTEMQARGLNLANDLMISAKHHHGVDQLMDLTWDKMPEGPLLYPDEDQMSDRPMRYFVSERIREQLFRKLGEEIPYSCAVKVDRFQENSKPVRIEATIVVERDSQKGMVVGAKGKKIKEIGIDSRKSIEDFLGQKIFLGLRVDVNHLWTRDPKRMRDLGYDVAATKGRGSR